MASCSHDPSTKWILAGFHECVQGVIKRKAPTTLQRDDDGEGREGHVELVAQSRGVARDALRERDRNHRHDHVADYRQSGQPSDDAETDSDSPEELDDDSQ